MENYRTSFDTEHPPGLSLIPYDSTFSANNYNLLDLKLPGAKRKVDLTEDDNVIISYQTDGYNLLLPRAYSLQDYYKVKKRWEMNRNFREIVLDDLDKSDESGGGKLEVIGADIAGQRVSLQVSGNINVSGKLQNQKRDEVRTNYQGKSTTFIIDQKQQLNIEGKIGDRISMQVDQDSEREFDFQNNMRIHYTGKEDEIVQQVDAGNISLTLPGTQLVTFSSKNSGLFGVKSLMKLGGFDITTIASVEKGQKDQISLDGGAQSNVTEIKDYNYKRNIYFYLDKQYRRDMWRGYWTGTKYLFTRNPDRVVSDLEVYKSVNMESSESFQATAYVDPGEGQRNEETAATDIMFQRLEKNVDYSYDKDLGYIRLNTQLQTSEVLAVAYRTVNEAGQTVEEYGDWGNVDDTTDVVLKLIKPQNMRPDDETWPLMWKNVYDLGTRNVQEDGTEIKIVYTDGSTGENERNDAGETFLEVMGVDEQKESGAIGQDGQFDLSNTNIIKLSSGEIWFPYLHPFQSGDDSYYESNPNLSDKYDSKIFYTKTLDNNKSQINSQSKFVIEFKSENRSSVLDLGFMVKEGSETVTLNGQELTKGVDYSIDYFSGTLTLLTDEATNPDANLDVKYEKNQMFELNKKTILGTRVEHKFGGDPDKFIGGTFLYYSKSVVDEKVDVGYEPMRNVVWDLNGKYTEEFDFVTRALDRLPLIETNKPTKVDFEAEIARVHPNPNTINNPETGDNNGVAFIDDFEGSKRTTPPSIMRNFWTTSSVPVDKTSEMRGKLNFYNPWQRWPTKDIWPNKETSTQAGNNRTDVMVLDFDPEWARAVGKNADDSKKRKAWGGTSYFLRASERDQSRTKFIDIWIKGNRGKLHIDLGTISEDQIDNGKLDTEDIPEAGLIYGNGILEKHEDVGLDGVPDEEETVEVTYPNGETEILGYGDEELREFKRNPQDPHSDNWYWQNQSDDYDKINGTEGNGTGQPIDAGGKYPDTENMNENKNVDLENDYVTVEIPLDNSSEYTEAPGSKEWRLFRVPLKDFMPVKETSNFNWENVEAMRLWMDGVKEQNRIYIAKIEMVGNDWLEQGIAQHEDSSYVSDEQSLETYAIKVLNTEENPSYYSPEGVQGEYDKINKIRAKEQSLAFELFQTGPGLRRNEKCMVEKGLLEEMSLINYKKIKYFIHGPEDIQKSDSLYHFLKFGRQTSVDHMYEIRTVVEAGWQEIEVTMKDLTQLKKYYPENIHEFDEEKMGGTLTIETDSEGKVVRRIFKIKEDGKFTGEQYIINGEPAIPRIETLQMGLINRGAHPFYGEVWVDELRVTDVNKEPGVAMRSQFSVALADVGNFSVNYSKQDANFHRVEQKAPSNTGGLNNTDRIRLNGKLAVDKFMPTKWGLKIPVSASYTESNSTPKYYPGTDILAGSAAPDSIKDLRHSYGFNTSFSKRPSDFWLTKYTIDQLNLDYSAKWGYSSNINTMRDRSTSYHGKVSYRIPFGNDNSIEPFKWAEGLPLVGEKLSTMKWYYTPSKLSVATQATESHALRIPRGKGKSDTTYTFGLNSNINFGYKIFDNLDMNYSRSMKNNLREHRYNKTAIITNLDLGVTENVNESYKITYNPEIASWLRPNFSANSNYTWSEPLNSRSVSVDQLSNRSSISSSLSLDPAEIWKSTFMSSGSASGSGGRGRSRGRSARGRSRGRNTQDSQEQEEKDEGGNFAGTIHSGLDILEPIKMRYGINRSVSNGYRQGKPGLKYRMGLTKDPELPIIYEEAGAGIDNITNSKNLSLNSGLSLFKNINTSLTYTNNESVTLSQGERSETRSQSFLPLGNDGSDGLPFPQWSVNWSGVEKLALINKIKFIESISVSHGFGGKEDISVRDSVLQKSAYRFNFQPLIGVNFSFTNKMSGNLRMNQSKTISNNPTTGGTTMNLTKSINASLNYTKKGGMKLPLPFFDDKQLENNIKFSMNFALSENETLQRKGGDEDGGGEFTTTNKTSNWNITPRINYSVSRNVTGSIFFKYSVSSSKRRGDNTTMDGGITVNIAIRG